MNVTTPIIGLRHILMGLVIVLAAVSLGPALEMGVLFLIAVAVLPLLLVTLYVREQYLRYSRQGISQYVLLMKQKALGRPK